MSIDLVEFQKRFDELFESTTPETFWEFVDKRRKENLDADYSGAEHVTIPATDGINLIVTCAVGSPLQQQLNDDRVEDTEESKAFVAKHVEKVFQLLKDSYIEQHIKPMFDSLSAASIQHFLDTGTVNGGFYEALNKLMDNARNFGGNRDEIERLTLEKDLAQSCNRKLVEALKKIGNHPEEAARMFPLAVIIELKRIATEALNNNL